MFRDGDPAPFLLAPDRRETNPASLDCFWAAVDEVPLEEADRPIPEISVTPRRDRDAAPAGR